MSRTTILEGPQQRSESPVLLRKNGPLCAVKLLLGTLHIEIWDFTKEEADPYARLRIEQREFAEGEASTGEEDPSVWATLSLVESSNIGAIIHEWSTALSANLPAHASPAVTARIGAVHLRLHGPSNDVIPKAEVSIILPGKQTDTAILTYIEARVLAGVLGTMSNEPEDSQVE